MQVIKIDYCQEYGNVIKKAAALIYKKMLLRIYRYNYRHCHYSNEIYKKSISRTKSCRSNATVISAFLLKIIHNKCQSFNHEFEEWV